MFSGIVEEYAEVVRIVKEQEKSAPHLEMFVCGRTENRPEYLS